MDGSQFDTLAKTLAAAGSRRFALRGLIAGALTLVGGHQTQDAAAAKSVKQCKKIDNEKKRQKCLKKARQQTISTAIPTGGTVVVPPPPASTPATCSDTIQNGSETEVDCGGAVCDRCAVGLGCLGGADCETSFCVDTVCGVCATTSQCPAGCSCAAGTCFSNTSTKAPSCDACPRYSYCAPFGDGTFECFPPCA
jgi:hypothetical protein